MPSTRPQSTPDGRGRGALHPGGVLVGPVHDGLLRRGDLRVAEDETRRLMSEPGDRVIYEATFTHDGVLVLTDLFFREAGRCRFTEIKAGTSVEKYHVQDAAIQAWVLRGSGVPMSARGLPASPVTRRSARLTLVDLPGSAAILIVGADLWLSQSVRAHYFLRACSSGTVETRNKRLGLPPLPRSSPCWASSASTSSATPAFGVPVLCG
jgi:hypothetical protein